MQRYWAMIHNIEPCWCIIEPALNALLSQHWAIYWCLSHSSIELFWCLMLCCIVQSSLHLNWARIMRLWTVRMRKLRNMASIDGGRQKVKTWYYILSRERRRVGANHFPCTGLNPTQEVDILARTIAKRSERIPSVAPYITFHSRLLRTFLLSFFSHAG